MSQPQTSAAPVAPADKPTELREYRADTLRLLLVALLVATPVVYAVTRSHVSEFDRILLRAACISTEIGFAIALGLILISKRRDLTGVGAGLATGIAVSFAIGASLWAALEVTLGNSKAPGLGGVIGVGVLLCAITTVAALRQARSRWPAFAAGILSTIFVHSTVGGTASTMLSASQQRVQQARTSDRSREYLATQLVYSLTGCALTIQAQSENHAFPAALSELGIGTRCSAPPVTSTSLEGYTLTYVAKAGDNAQRGADFQIVAAPQPDAGMLGTVVSDARGVVFLIHDFPSSAQRSDTGAYVVHRARGLSFITGYRNIVNGYLEKMGAGDAPDSLAQVAARDPDRAGRYFAAMSKDTSYRVT